MKDEKSNLEQSAPKIIWVVRLGFCAVIWLFGKYLMTSISLGTVSGEIILGSFVALGTIALLASFIRSKISLILLAFSITAIPIAVFLSMDAMLNGAWWEWLLAIPLQIGIPFAVAFYLWKAPNVKNYYFPNQK